ncbi:MAG: hypothetical protein U1E65_09170 [Myxococcota bacterium]
MSTRAQRVQREAATVIGFAWAIAFLILPIAHALHHAPNHTHLGESVLFAKLHGHTHAAPRHKPEPGPSCSDQGSPSLEHQASGAAHLLASLGASPASVLASPWSGCLPLQGLVPSSQPRAAFVRRGAGPRAPPLARA